MKIQSRFYQILPRREFLIFSGKLSLLLGSIFFPTVLLLKRKTPFRNQEPLSLDNSQFLSLSQVITGKTKLDPKTGEKILNAFNSDSVKKQELIHLYEKCGLTETLNSTHQELHGDILSTWYTGIYSNHETSTRLSYFDALMYRPTVGIKNIPSSCGGALGYWTLPPTLENA